MTSATHLEHEDFAWTIAVGDHAQRTDTPVYRRSRKLMIAAVAQVQPWFLGPPPYQDHHGGAAWVVTPDGPRMYLLPAGIEWSAQFCADPAKVDVLRQWALTLVNGFPGTRQWYRDLGMTPADLAILTTAIKDPAGVAAWTDSFWNASVPLPADKHTGVLPKGAGFHHYPKPICVGYGTPVLTSLGQVPIQDVRPGMLVATRQGWRRVLAHRRTGTRDVLRIRVNGQDLLVTDDHLIATSDGWTAAGSLLRGAGVCTMACAAPTPTRGRGDDVLRSELVTMDAVRLPRVDREGRRAAETVGSVGDCLQMVGIDARSDVAGVVRFQTVRNGAFPQGVGQLVNGRVAASSVAVVEAGSRLLPDPASVGVDCDPRQNIRLVERHRVAFDQGAPAAAGAASVDDDPTVKAGLNQSRAVDAGLVDVEALDVFEVAQALLASVHAIEDITTEGPIAVFDLEVEGAHEFVAAGVVVHNCDIELFKRDDFVLFVDDGQGGHAAVAPVAPRGSGAGEVQVLYADPASPLGRAHSHAHAKGHPLVLPADAPQAVAAFAQQAAARP